MSSTEVFSSAAVAAPHQLASAAGRDLLAAGANAVEAMVGMAAVMAVVYPHMTGIGGDAFWLLREPKGRVRAFEACGPAGSLATAERYRALGYDAIPARGPLAALTVPGAIGGWALALDYARSCGGRMELRDLLGPAISLAGQGYALSASQARCHPHEEASLREAPGFAATFLAGADWPKAGDTRRQEKLAGTLDQLASAGLADFYRGDVGREIAADLERIGSPVTRADLERFAARVREPLSMSLPGRTLFNFPPPTQGLASLIVLGLFERLGVQQSDGFAYIHGLVEATKRAFFWRDRFCVDPAFADAPVGPLLEPDFLQGEAELISMRRAASFPLPQAEGDTVWMGAIDGDGLAVSYIQSIYWDYGSGCVLPRTGVLMQNRGISFALDPASHHLLRPGRKPFHTLNPALAVFEDGRVMPYGTMGGDGQPQVQAQVLTRYECGMGLAEAIAAPRFIYGRTWGAPSTLLNLENDFDPTVLRELESAGHELALHNLARAEAFGHAGALVRHRNGRVEAAHDPRSDGGAAGL